MYRQNPEYLVQQNQDGEELKVVVESIKDAETVSWVDKIVDGG